MTHPVDLVLYSMDINLVYLESSYEELVQEQWEGTDILNSWEYVAGETQGLE